MNVNHLTDIIILIFCSLPPLYSLSKFAVLWVAGSTPAWCTSDTVAFRFLHFKKFIYTKLVTLIFKNGTNSNLSTTD